MDNPFILGCAQLGMNYGIANRSGKPGPKEILAIVQAALAGGINVFDTAAAYGSSESSLGLALKECGVQDKAKIITKIPPDALLSADAMLSRVRNSLERLGVSHLHCLMLHQQKQLPLLDQWQGECLKSFLEKKVAASLGISVYAPQWALRALAHPLISIVQMPSSIFDRRFLNARVFERAAALGKELHIRSIFLQGILAMEPGELPEKLAGMAPALARLQNICETCGFSALRGALIFMLDIASRFHCRIVIGAETSRQILEHLDFINNQTELPLELLQAMKNVFPPQTSKFLDPSTW